MANPIFSIIIPTYNAAKTLATCLESIKNQTFASYEILVMDGASSDGTIQLAISSGVPVHLYSEKDNGIYDAMNKGIANASGEWLYFLGCDDTLFDSSVLERVAGRLKQGANVVYGDVFLQQSRLTYDGEFDFMKLTTKNLSHQAVFYHRSVFKKLGEYDISYRFLADWEFNLRCMGGKKGMTSQYMNVTICAYGETGTSNQSATDVEYKRLFPSKSAVIRKYGNFKLQWKHLIKPAIGHLLGQKR